MRKLASTIHSLLTTDFCPGANAYVYWLKQPVGWFCAALAACILVGAFLNPIGWSISAGLAAIILLGLGFPWFATKCLRCTLSCDRDAIHEGDQAHILLSVKNPLPLPIMGLTVKGYFAPSTSDESSGSECGLARVPAFSSAQYRLPIEPEYRGRFPAETPKIACAFPFGIYTAHRSISRAASVIVRPMVIPLTADFEWSGNSIAETGFGKRASDHGEFLGVREFRRGDSLRSIHWTQSARQDEIIVCERGGPEKSPVALRLSTQRCPGSRWDARENLAWRIRIAASLVDFFVARHIPFDLVIDDRKERLGQGGAAKASAWDALAEIPLEPWYDEATKSTNEAPVGSTTNQGISVGVDSTAGTESSAQYIVISCDLGATSNRYRGSTAPTKIDLEQPIDLQLAKLLQEVSNDTAAA